MKSFTADGLHADLQTQVVHRTHHPQVAGSSDVKLQPAFLSSPQPARLQQDQICFSIATRQKKKKKKKKNKEVWSNSNLLTNYNFR